MYLVGLFVGLPCLIFLIYTYTPKGKRWMKMNEGRIFAPRPAKQQNNLSASLPWNGRWGF